MPGTAKKRDDDRERWQATFAGEDTSNPTEHPLDAARWQTVQRIFRAAVELPEGEWQSLLPASIEVTGADSQGDLRRAYQRLCADPQ